jgi:hypothetical protein
VARSPLARHGCSPTSLGVKLAANTRASVATDNKVPSFAKQTLEHFKFQAIRHSLS